MTVALVSRTYLAVAPRDSMQQPKQDVVIWAADLKAGRLPRVSPISGETPVVQRTFRFRTAPPWAIAVVVAGILVGVGWIPGIVIMLAASKTASGPVFITAREQSSIRLKIALTWGSLGAAVLFLILTFAFASNSSAPTGLFLLLVLVALLIWAACVLFVMPRIRPRAVVRDVPPTGARSVLLKQVAPAFAAEVQRMYGPPAPPEPRAP